MTLWHTYALVYLEIFLWDSWFCKLQVFETFFKIFEHTDKLGKEFEEHSLKAFRSETEHTSERNPLLSK